MGVNRPAGQTRGGVWASGRLAGHAADAQSRRRTAPSTEPDPGHVAAAQTRPELASGRWASANGEDHRQDHGARLVGPHPGLGWHR